MFRGKSGKLIKILWHDGLGMSLYAKRLEHGRFIWPSLADGALVITPAQRHKIKNFCRIKGLAAHHHTIRQARSKLPGRDHLVGVLYW